GCGTGCRDGAYQLRSPPETRGEQARIGQTSKLRFVRRMYAGYGHPGIDGRAAIRALSFPSAVRMATRWPVDTRRAWPRSLRLPAVVAPDRMIVGHLHQHDRHPVGIAHPHLDQPP